MTFAFHCITFASFLCAPEAVSSFGSCSAGLFASWWAHQAATSLGNTARAWRQMQIKRPDAGFLLHRSNQTLFWNMLLSEKYQMILTWKRQDEQQGFQTDTFWLFLSGFYSITPRAANLCTSGAVLEPVQSLACKLSTRETSPESTDWSCCTVSVVGYLWSTKVGHLCALIQQNTPMSGYSNTDAALVSKNWLFAELL